MVFNGTALESQLPTGMNASLKKVLIVSYFYPPLGGVGVQRTLKTSKYLPKFGWHPIVLTVKNPEYELFDYTLVKEISPTTSAVPACTFSPVPLLRCVRKFLISSRRAKNSNSPQGVTTDATNLSWWRKAGQFIFFPDIFCGWIPGATIRGCQVLNSDCIDLIYSSSPPYSCLFVAYFLKLFSGLPWVIDMRDPWLENTLLIKPSSFHIKLIKYFQNIFFEAANAVISNTWSTRDRMLMNHKTLSRDKFFIVTNGFDPEDFVSLPKMRFEQFTIAHVGSIYGIRSSVAILRAISALVKKFPWVRTRLRFVQVGYLDHLNQKKFDESVRDNQLQDVVENRGFCSHAQAITLMQRANLLVLLSFDSDSGTIPAKFFEYLATGNPILVISNNSQLLSFAKRFAWVTCFDPDRLNEIVEFLSAQITKPQNAENYSSVAHIIEPFTRQALTGQLVNVFNRCCSLPMEKKI